MPENTSDTPLDNSNTSYESVIKRAEQGALSVIDLMTAADRLNAEGQKPKTIALYRVWLEHTTSPLSYVGFFNLGVELASEREYLQAEAMYRKTLELNSDFLRARLNLGNCLEQQKREDEALEEWRAALRSESIQLPENLSLQLHALNNLGRLLEIKKNYKEALDMLEKSFALDSTQRDVLLHLVHLIQKICRWPVFTPPKGITKEEMISGTSPLAMLAASDDPVLQLAAARQFVAHKYPNITSEVLAAKEGYHHDKIRIGYLSSDFCLHAVSLLTVELLELHDHERFEVYGFCWSREDGTAIQKRVINAMDHYIKIGGMSDREAAECIRSHEIDIMIDLQGLTSGARPLILSYRPAILQMTYLGFPGTTGLPWIDYVIADKYLIPEELVPYHTEKPLYMPNCFQSSDSKREVGPLPQRADNELPEKAFVFCSFNNNYKFTPELFGVWMRILKRVPGSVLWLLADNEWSRENLCQAARKQGIKRDRLIFAPRVAPADYLARYQLADLFLDTFPFNGGTTANDALFMGLPLLTLSGRTFASRMAGSLLTNLGLPELITTSMEEYEEKAVKYAKKRPELKALQKRLRENASRVFDIPPLVRDMENQMVRVLNNINRDRFNELRQEKHIAEKTERSIPVDPPDGIRRKLAVYTVLVGDKEQLNNPLHYIADRTGTDIDLDFICFTDNPHLQSDTWRFERLDFPPLPPEKLSRRPKALPHEYLSEYDYSLYIDNTIVFKRLPNRSDLCVSIPGVFRALRHPWRTVPLDEADMVIWSGLDNTQTVNSQIEFCATVAPLDKITHLTSGTVILRNHNDPKLIKFGTVWWEHILAFSRRDQLSLDFALDITGNSINYFEGDLVNNDLIVWPVLADGHRVQANFDKELYAWVHRDNPEATHNPKKHFLTYGKGSDADYKQVVPWFEHTCRRFASSLGAFTMPRRSMAAVLDPVLARNKRDGAHVLVVRVESASPFAFEASEFTTAVHAMRGYYKYSKAPVINSVTIKEQELASEAPYTAAYGISNYDTILIFGIPASNALELARKFLPLIRHNNGTMVLHLNESASMPVIEGMWQLINASGSASLSIHHSCHAEYPGIIPNTLLMLDL